MKVKAVSAYVPLEVKHLTRTQYYDYGKKLEDLGVHVFWDYPLESCWLYKWLESNKLLNLPPATDPPADRYQTPKHMVLSNIVQHERPVWLHEASNQFKNYNVFVWLDLALLKQGHFTGKPVMEDHISSFLSKVDRAEFHDIPFPGIWEKGAPADKGDNWRFVGSTHIIPKSYLSSVEAWYKSQCRQFICRTKTVPLDLPIWALTELHSGLPFTQYKANHDATQLTNFPY